jgi:N,N'-diacetyllegionaminate synthase
MKIGNLDTDERVVVIAEIGNNHEGNYSTAEKMVWAAAQAGADAVKFQTFRAEHLVSPKEEARLAQLRSFELTFKQFEQLKNIADRAGVMFISTPFDIESAAFLDALVPAFKIASGDNTFYPLIDSIARFGKPIILSCGIAELPELRYAKSRIEETWKKTSAWPGLAVLHCVTSYPVPEDQANLAAIRTLGEALGCEIGYSDHTLGIEAAVLSVGVGARIVEKHFSLDKNFSSFRDHQLSADPDEFQRLVQRIRTAEMLLGTGVKILQESEKAIKSVVRRSIVAARDLKAGQVLHLEDITWVRPGGGLPPGDENLVLGKVLQRDLSRGEQLTLNIFC